MAARISRREFAGMLGTSILSCSACHLGLSDPSRSTDRPNFILFFVDDMGYGDLSSYGHPTIRTPSLDRLAERGTLFEHAFSQSPVCTPSRGAFLTGRYPRTCRARQNGADIPADEVLVTRLLADAGYVCGLSGKLHLSACNPSVCSDMERRIDDGYAEFHWSHHSGGGWGLHNEYWAWLSDKGLTYETPAHAECEYVRVGMPAEHHQTTWCAEKACDFMRDRAQDGQPWRPSG